MAYNRKNINVKNTLFWHDYETFGSDSQRDKPSQFAGIRTDEDLNIIEGTEVNIYCKPSLDTIPDIGACLVTKVTPQEADSKGVNEVSFFSKIEQVLSEAGTCGAGYNSINFDDEVTRNGFYRNFKDPYEREWKNNCSRWDLIDVLRMVHAISPDTFNLNYVEDDKGQVKKSFRLEELSVLNGIEHENAHDALSDVKATIAMAKIVKETHPEIYDILYSQRQKNTVKNNIQIGKPFLCASAFFGMKHEYLEVLLPIATNPTQRDRWNDLYCIKITDDNIESLLSMSAEELRELLYKKNEDLLGTEERPPIHILRVNKCPVILPLSYLSKERALELGINGEQCKLNIQKINENKENITKKVIDIFQKQAEYEEITDPDLMIYSGGFWNEQEKQYILKINKTPAADLMDIDFSGLHNSRIPEMLFRFVGRNFPDVFGPEEYNRWLDYCKKRLTEEGSSSSLTFESSLEKINSAREKANGEEELKIIEKVENYILELKRTLNL